MLHSESLGRELVCLVIISNDVSTDTQECDYIEYAIRIPATEQVAQVEHSINTRSNILVLEGNISVLSIVQQVLLPTTLALKTISNETGTAYRSKLIAKTNLEVRRNQSLNLASPRVYCAPP